MSVVQPMGDQMIRHSAREHCEMLQAMTGTAKRFFDCIKVSMDHEGEGTRAICSLFSDAIGAIRDIPSMIQWPRDYTQPMAVPGNSGFQINSRDHSLPRAGNSAWQEGDVQHNWAPQHSVPEPFQGRY